MSVCETEAAQRSLKDSPSGEWHRALSTAEKARGKGAGVRCEGRLASSQTQMVSLVVVCGFHKTHRSFRKAW